MSPLELKHWRRRMRFGTQLQAAKALKVAKITYRFYETGRLPIPARVVEMCSMMELLRGEDA